MKVLIVDGYTQHCGDWLLGAKLKELGHEVMERECVQNWNALHVTLEDVLWAQAVCGYSFGVSSLWDVTDGWRRVAETGHKLALGVIVAGCPDWMKGQFDVWTPPGLAQRCYAFNASRGFPTSYGLKRGPIYDITRSDIDLILDEDPVATVRCDGLFAAGMNPLDIHKTIQNRAEVLAAIAGLVGTAETQPKGCTTNTQPKGCTTNPTNTTNTTNTTNNTMNAMESA